MEFWESAASEHVNPPYTAQLWVDDSTGVEARTNSTESMTPKMRNTKP